MSDVLLEPDLASAMVAFRGLRIASPASFVDQRGGLSVFEHGLQMGFVARRTFFIEFAGAGPEAPARAEHATSCNQLLVALRGKVRIDLDNGTARHSVTGTALGAGFLVAAGVWRRIVALEPHTLLMVLADASYAETRYFTAPMPDLIAANTPDPLE